MLELEQAFSAPIAHSAHGWVEMWGVAHVAAEIRVRFSHRMFRSVGRCYPLRRLVTLAAVVPAMEEPQIRHILCHELAHLAAFERYGRNIKPHGREWRSLMRAAGFEPKVRFDDEKALALLQASGPRRTRYLHRCPICAAQRTATREMRRWRCGACYELGAEGRLQITEVVL